MGFVLFVGDFLATFSALTDVSVQTVWIDEDGNLAHIEKPFLVDTVDTLAGSATGCTTVTTFIESTIGVEAGGRTGISAITTSVLFLICIMFSLLFLMIPSCVNGVALIFVGFSMLSSFQSTVFSGFRYYFGPAVLIIFTGDIADSVSLGILADVFIKVINRKAKEFHPFMYALCIPLILYFIVRFSNELARVDMS